MSETITINSLTSLAHAIARMDEEWHEHRYIEIEIKRKASQRTLTQNKALHKFCALLAEALNQAGYDMTVFPWREGLELPWSCASVKEYLWRPVQQAMTDKRSTTELTTVDPTAIHQALCRTIAERTGVEVPPWPSREGE